MLVSIDEDGIPTEKSDPFSNIAFSEETTRADETNPSESINENEANASTTQADSEMSSFLEPSGAANESAVSTNDANVTADSNFCTGIKLGYDQTDSIAGNSIVSFPSFPLRGTMLPWGAHKERPILPLLTVDTEMRPGEFVMCSLFIEFTVQAERKMDFVMSEPLDKPIAKSLQRGEDPQLDQILCAFGTVAEYCLPSLLRALFNWFERQMHYSSHIADQAKRPQQDQKNKSIIYIVSGQGPVPEGIERTSEELQLERRDLAVEFLFCLALIEILKQLPFHPGHEDLVQYIENLAFKRFNYKEGIQTSQNAVNIHMIADLYAEVIGVLAQSRFMSVRKRFTLELKELKSKELSPHTTQSIISLLMGMKFFRVKMVPIEEFEASFQFLQECAQYFLDVKDKDIKHALAGLFVEILVPVAASVKNEVNVPCLKNFVEMLYTQTLDASTKSKHRMALFPLVTCLLCVSQKTFFLANWHCFLAMCLSHLKNRDPKMCRVALESLYRLLWVYMIRIKCESNSATQSRLQSIVNSLFPKGSKGVVPRDTPLNIFVKIIQFIAQERLDFAMREIVFELLMVGRPIKMILTPERMSIGLRAFLVVADSLQQKEGEPPMPRTTGTMPSGNTLRVKKTFLNKVLTDETARSIGMSAYFPYIRRILVDILRALDLHYGRPLSLTSTQNITKELEINTGDRKPKIDLFRTCIAAIPRLIPDGMSSVELVEMLSRLTVHVDEELRGLAYQSLQTLVVDFPDWRQEVLAGFTQFLAREIQDTLPNLVDNSLRMLLQLITSWKNNATVPNTSGNAVVKQEPAVSVIRGVEALALVMLCQNRLYPRRLAAHILRETKLLLEKLESRDECAVIDAMDACCASVVDACLPLLPAVEKQALLSVAQLDFQWFCERSHPVWTPGIQYDESNGKTGVALNNVNIGDDPWGKLLIGLMERDKIPLKCPTAVHHTWPILHARINALYVVIDPIPVSDNRASLLRSATAPRKPTNERDVYIHVWKNYLTLAFRVVPPIPSPIVRCGSPDISLSVESTYSWLENASNKLFNDPSLSTSLENLYNQTQLPGRFTIPLAYGRKEKHKRISSSPDSLSGERSDSKSPGGNASPCILYKLVIPLLKCELSDVRDVAVHAIGHINSDALKDLMEEMVGLIREAVDRKQENMRRRRRRDALRLHLGRVLQLISENGTFANSTSVLENGSLHSTYVEYIEGARLCLELEADKDSSSLQEVKLIFCNFVTKIIKSFPLETYTTLLKKDLRKNLFQLFSGWAGSYSKFLGPFSPSAQILQANNEADEELQYAALEAMSAIAYCGSCFVPGALSEEGFFYPWLQELLSSKNDKIYQLARETVVLLLDMNHDIGPLLDWVIDKCYTGESRVADGAFLALAMIFSTREYPCDHYTAVINVTLMCTGCPRAHVYEAAFQLLLLLDKRFFGNVNLLPGDGDALGNDRNGGTLDVLLSRNYCRSQSYLSQQLSQLHPELTMPMFSEITYRFQTARFEVRQLLPQYLLPWLVNIELVDPNVPPSNPLSYFQYESKHPGCRREGMGSAEATEMVLNNLFYITAKFSDHHPKEIEELWSKLCSCWPNNLKVIMRYLIIISGMAPNELLIYAKRVVLYLARALPERLLDEMLTELQTVETLNCLIERTETPPFYRLTSMRKASSSHSEGGPVTSGAPDNNGRCDLTVEKGTIHTKRHSGEDPTKSTSKVDKLSARSGDTFTVIEKLPRVQVPSPQLRSDEQSSNNELDNSQTEEMFSNQRPISSGHHFIVGYDKFDVPQPHPLPMPEYGGYFAPLKEYLPDNSQPISGFHRCNVAVILLCDVVLDGIQLEWSIHVPLMLHIVFLGLDHTRSLVHDHCRQLLLNLLLAVATHNDHLSVAKILLYSQTAKLGLGLPIPLLPVVKHTFTEPDAVFDNALHGNVSLPQNPHVHFDGEIAADKNCNPPVIVTTTAAGDPPDVTDEGEDNSEKKCSSRASSEATVEAAPKASSVPANTALQPGSDMSTSDIIKSLILFLATRPSNTPLWNYEDITAKVWSVRSCCQLNALLQHVLKVFRDSFPHAHISERWAQTALQLGLSCSSRHYAGRSLQVFRFIGVSMTGRMVSDILSRLVETVAEQGEDMQGYVTELLLTLEAAVDSLESNFRPLDFMKEIFKSTPNLNNKDLQGHVNSTGKHSPGGCGGCMTNHTRSTSYSVSYCMRKNTSSPANETKERNRGGCSEMSKMCSNLCRSRSAQSLKMLGDSATQDDKLTILATLFWLAVSLLESDYEHEFLLGVRLLGRVMHRLPLDRPDARDRVDRLQLQLRWPNFPGVHALLLKGCTHPATYESVVGLLTELTPLLELSVIDPTQSLAFPMNVIALLPYMLLHYEDANETCIWAAHHIAQVSVEKSKKLENLGTVMTLYSRRTFSKESFQWTKCVVKYLFDTYSHLSMQMLAFLVEILDKGAPSLQLPVLSVLHCMLHYIDLNSNSPHPINSDLLRVISKFIDGGSNYKEAMKILKLVVTRCSTLVVPPHWDTNTTSSIIDTELQIKKELPGRTMDFTFDLSQTPVIGRKYLPKGSTGPNSLTTGLSNATPEKSGDKSNAGSGPSSVSGTISNTATVDESSLGTVQSTCLEKLEKSDSIPPENTSCESPRRSMSLSPADAAHISGWKRPWNSQARVRDCLVNLLTTCGQRVGLPKSPSVIFSQSSELLERESSMTSSLEEVSGAHGDYSGGSRSHDAPPDHFAVFKDFDFLEYESESIEGESTDNFNWGVRRPPLSGDMEVDMITQSHQMHTNANLMGAELPQSSLPVDLSPELTLPTSTVNLVLENPFEANLKDAVHPLEESSDEEVESDSRLYDRYIHEATRANRSRAHSLSSGSSGGDLGDVTPCNAVSPGLVARPLTFRNPHEESWRSSILAMLRGTPHTQPLQLVYRSSVMLKEVISKTIILCEEGSGYLSTGVGHAFTTVIDLLNNEEPPLIWTSPNIIDSPKLFDLVRFAALEMDEHLETFFDRKDHAHECVESARGSVVCDEVGRSLYKLIFQLHLLLETNIKLVSEIYKEAISKNAIDNSAAIVTIGNALTSCIRGTDNCWGSEGENTPTPSTCPSPCPSPSPHQPANSGTVCDDNTLVQLLNEHRWGTALNLLRERNTIKVLIKDDLPEDDVTLLLHIYSKSLLSNRPDTVLITKPVGSLTQNLSTLMDNLFKVSMALKAPHADRIHSI